MVDLAGKIIINNFEIKDFVQAYFQTLISKFFKDKHDLFVITRNLEPNNMFLLKKLIENNPTCIVKYYDFRNKLFGTLADGQFFGYKLNRQTETLKLTGRVLF